MIFSYRNFERMCEIFADYNSEIIIKHDVETLSKSALALAKIEHSYGIRAIFFYQFDVFLKDIEMVRSISSLGHEIGYHYDVLDNNNGDLASADLEFQRNLQIFSNNGFEIKWICPHGNPALKRVGWNSNKDFFRSDSVRSKYQGLKDIVVDKELFFSGFSYISDAGYSFKAIRSVSDNDKVASNDVEIPDIFSYLKNRRDTPVIVSTHPHRWVKYRLIFLGKRSLFLLLKSIYRFTHKVPVLSLIYGRLFRLSRKF